MAKFLSILFSPNWWNYIVICWLPTCFLFFQCFFHFNFLLVFNYIHNIYLFRKLNIHFTFKEGQMWLTQLAHCEPNFTNVKVKIKDEMLWYIKYVYNYGKNCIKFYRGRNDLVFLPWKLNFLYQELMYT